MQILNVVWIIQMMLGGFQLIFQPTFQSNLKYLHKFLFSMLSLYERVKTPPSSHPHMKIKALK